MYSDKSIKPIIFIGKLNTKLSTLDLQKNINDLTKLLVPTLADWCTIHMVVEGGNLIRLKTFFNDPKKANIARIFSKKYKDSKNAPPSKYLTKVLKTKKTVIVRNIDESWYKQAARDSEHYKLLKELNPKSHMLVPLLTHSGLIGIISLARNKNSHGFNKTDEILINQIAHKAAMAIENSILYKKIQQQNDRLLNTVSNVPGIVWEAWGKPSKNIPQNNYVSDYIEKMLGYTPKEWLSSPDFWIKIIHPDDKKRVIKESTEIFNSGIGGVNRFRWLKKDKTPVWVEAHSKVILDESGKPQGMRGVTMDITERKKAEDVLSRLAAIVESSDDAIISKDLKGIVQSWNKGAERLYGYTESEILGKSIAKIFPEDRKEEFYEMMEVINMGEAIDHFETKRVSKNGRLIDVSLSIAPLKDANGKVIGASAIGRDISESKELERRKDAFIGMASHELKTPITTMKAFVQILQKKLEPLKDAKLEYFLDKTNQQLDRLTDLISSLLDLSKIQSGQLDLNKEKFDFDSLISTAVEDIQGLANNHKIQVKGKSGYIVYGDKHRILQVMTNLLNNAIKYSPGAEKVVIKILPDENKVTVAVQDFGIGISKVHQKRIFDRFFRASGASEKTFPGLGIGLYISSQFIHRHGGKIWVDSAKQKGSTFYFSIPLK